MTEPEQIEEVEESDWLPEESKKAVSRRPKPDYQELAGHCESCQ